MVHWCEYNEQKLLGTKEVRDGIDQNSRFNKVVRNIMIKSDKLIYSFGGKGHSVKLNGKLSTLGITILFYSLPVFRDVQPLH